MDEIKLPDWMHRTPEQGVRVMDEILPDWMHRTPAVEPLPEYTDGVDLWNKLQRQSIDRHRKAAQAAAQAAAGRIIHPRPGRPSDPRRELQLAALFAEVEATGCTLRTAAARVAAREHGVAPAMLDVQVVEILAEHSGGVPELAKLRVKTQRLWKASREV